MQALLGKSREELKDYLTSVGEPGYRAQQLEKWLYQNVPFEEMSNLPAPLREKLRSEAEEGYLKLIEKAEAKDGTVKYLFQLADGNTVETVYLPKDYGNSICISSQVGCAMGCKFCASTQNGLVRNLTAGEMLAQITAVNADQGEEKRVNHIVVMGMGEPLANLDNLLSFLRSASSPDGLGISQRSITVSTCGLIPAMQKLADEKLQITLAVSLHSALQKEREKIMPAAKGNPLPDLVKTARGYFDKTGRRITFEYALIEGVNDRREDLDALQKLLGGFPAHVNIIPLNSWSEMHAPSQRRVYAFAEELERRGIGATVRRSMGSEIEGACGQLRQRRLDKSAEDVANSGNTAAELQGTVK